MVRNKRLLRRFSPTFLLIIVISLSTLGWYAMTELRDSYFTQTSKDLAARAHFVEQQVAGRWATADPSGLDVLCKSLGRNTATRITLILPAGRVVGDSEEDPQVMDNHATRPEVKEALSGRMGRSMRFSRTLQKQMMYLALPLKKEAKVVGVIRTAIPVTDLERVLSTFRYRIFLGTFLVALLTAVISLFASRRISRPMKEIKRGAERFAQGELDYRLPRPDSGELGGLSSALNRMAGQLKERIETIKAQRNEQEALLSGMVESVLAVDLQKRIIGMNRAAADMFGVTISDARGRSLQEVIRNVDLQEFIERILEDQGPVEEDIALYTGEEQHMQAHGTLLRDAEGGQTGVLIVLNDVTRIKRLENIRRDFFANVSHEIKTPVTAIRGYVETLLDGEEHSPEDQERFLGVIGKQCSRLIGIIEDFLALSAIEQGAEQGVIELSEGKVIDLLQGAVHVCEAKAAEREISIETVCNPDITARFNQPMMEQAVQNLIDNAIKYSERGSSVRVEGALNGRKITLRVLDRGTGIAREHLHRLFERFYRVDKARSRSLGGTGLGLAIVKHIVQVHGGYVSVESTPGKGSCFTISLPAV